MDTVVRLEPGVLLQNLTKANAAKVKRLRWSIAEEYWFPVTRDSRVDRRFWTLLQAFGTRTEYEDSYGSSQASTSVPCGPAWQQPPLYHRQYEGMV